MSMVDPKGEKIEGLVGELRKFSGIASVMGKGRWESGPEFRPDSHSDFGSKSGHRFLP
jgi:hypothetical protein